MSHPPVVINHPILVQIGRETIRKTKLYLFLQQMLIATIAKKASAPPLFESDFPRVFLHLNPGCGKTTVLRPFGLAIGANELFFSKTRRLYLEWWCCIGFYACAEGKFRRLSVRVSRGCHAQKRQQVLRVEHCSSETDFGGRDNVFGRFGQVEEFICADQRQRLDLIRHHDE